MELVDILVLGTSAEKRAGSNPAEGNIYFEIKIKSHPFYGCCIIFPSFLFIMSKQASRSDKVKVK
jgi:hypothetical protein